MGREAGTTTTKKGKSRKRSRKSEIGKRKGVRESYGFSGGATKATICADQECRVGSATTINNFRFPISDFRLPILNSICCCFCFAFQRIACPYHILLATLLLIACDPSPPPPEAQFRDEVAPVLEARCGAGVCHGITPSGRAAGEEIFEDSFAFYVDEGGNIEDWRQVRRESLRFVNTREDADFSTLVRKPLPAVYGGESHVGGDNFASIDDPALEALLRWIELEDAGGEDPTSDAVDEGELFFSEEVMSHLVGRNCASAACHGELAYNAFRLDPGMPGEGGEPRFGREMMRKNYEASRSFLALDGDPSQSRLLRKSLPLDAGGIGHRGGNRTFFTGLDDPAAKAVMEWADIERGEGAMEDSLRGVLWVEGPPRQASSFDVTAFHPGSDLFYREPAGPQGEVRNLTGHLHDGDADIRDPAVSVDGRRVVFSKRTDAGQGYALYELGLEGEEVRQLTDYDGHDVMATYGPDGVVYFVSDRHDWRVQDGSADLALFKVDPDRDDEPERLTFGVGAQLNPAYFDVGDMQGRLVVAHRRTLGPEDETVGFSMPLDLGADYHIYFGTTAAEEHLVGFSEMPDGRALTIAADPDNRWEGGQLALVDRNMGPDLEPHQSVEDASVPAFAKAFRVLATSSRSSGMSPGGVYRDPVALPDGTILVAWAPGPFDLSDGTQPPRFRIQRLWLREAPENCHSLECLPRIAKTETWVESSTPEKSVYAPQPVVDRRVVPVTESALDGANPTTFRLSDAAVNQAILEGLSPVGPLNIDDKARAVRFLEATPVGMGAEPGELSSGEHMPARILGEVELEADGSAYVELPPETPFRTQVLDEEGMALGGQHNRWIFAWPGQEFPESVDRHRFDAACGGCHGAMSGRPTDIPGSLDALTGATPTLAGFQDRNPRRPREPVVLGEETRREVSFRDDVQPILDRRCATVGCHAAQPDPAAGLVLEELPGERFSASYEALMAKGEGSGGGRKYVDLLHTRARTSRLVEIASGRRLDAPQDAGAHPAVAVSDEELRTIVEWIESGVAYQSVEEER